jgi:2-succinyl-5-enolpyruvyl-6-hydroxy-3-cyclohexene-1-carboxylate synthase
VAGRAVATALEGPAGVVHLDLPFREPLVPEGELSPTRDRRPADAAGPRARGDDDDGAHPASRLLAGRRTLDGGELDALASRLRGVERGLLVAGPQDDPALPAALARLAEATGWPILADALSLVRTGPHDRSSVVAHGDLLLRPGPWRDAHVPALVVRFGAPPTSKPFATLVAETDPVQLIVDGDLGWRDPSLGPATMVHADGAWLAAALADALADAPGARGSATTDAWRASWRRADDTVAATLAGWLAEATGRGDQIEMEPFALLPELLPDGAILWASSSMPVRDLDAWLPSTGRAIRPLANRGANGIDGVVSSALGAAAAGRGRVALVVGDLAFLHDLNALVAASRLALSATIVLVNNDGGGIFSFLPQASADAPGAGLPAHYEELFGTPHGVEPGPLVAALGGRHLRPAPGGLRAALVEALGSSGVTVVELRTDRERNLALHREVAARVATALDALEGLAPPSGRRPAGADR